jgi:hypothetical protein
VKPDQKDVLYEFLLNGKAIADAEKETLQWFAYKADEGGDDPARTSGVFSVYPDEDGRTAHVHGGIPRALIPRVPELLQGPPALDMIDVITHKVVKDPAHKGKLVRGAISIIKAKPEGAAEVKKAILVRARDFAYHVRAPC